jgi:uncharacterized protein YfaS (alpha-2-macroglobulin family)
MKRLIKFLTLVFTLLVVFFSCSPKKEKADTSEIIYSEDVAQIISRITAGTLQPDDHISITFVEGVVADEQVGKEVKNPFSFSPAIDGVAKWVYTDELVFVPDEKLTSRINYTGKLDLKAISEDFDDIDVDLKFYVEGRELISFVGDLELENPSSPNKLVYRGKVDFSQRATLEEIQKAASFASYDLNWNQETDRSFSFVSESITRPTETKRYNFVIKGQDMDLSESLERSVELVPVQQMQLTAVDMDEQGKHPKVLLKFSDQLDENQELNGFISVEPSVEFTLQKLGKYLMVDGDFRFGTEYSITVQQGVKSRWGTRIDQRVSRKVKFSDIQPQVQFSSSGIFMPTSNNKRLQFLTANLRRVHVEVKKVFDSNVERFFENESIQNSKNRNSEFSESYVSTVGAIVYNQTFEIGDEKNQWLIHNLALDNVLNEFSNGLYLIRINFNPHDVLVPINENELPYIQQNGQIYKPITISDIGLLAKEHSDNRVDVYTTDLKTGAPMSGVKVTVTRYNNSSSNNTNSEGVVTLSTGGYYNLIKAEKNGQVSIIKPWEMRWNNSGFNVGGISAYELNTRGFTYTERGVYRPGDTVNLSCIVRYGTKANTDNIPAYFKLYNPEGTLVQEQTQKGATDGFYNFTFGTDQNDPTGNWNAQVIVGNKYFYHNLKIETVVANRLKVNVTPAMRTLLPENKQLELEVEARYLFGASADGLPYETEVEIFEVQRAFPKYRDYSFFNQYIEFQDIKEKITAGKLNSEGIANVVWNVPNLRQAPSPLKVKLTATVQEEGGRPNNAWAFVDLHPFTHYVGIKEDLNYIKLNSKIDIPVVLVDHTGKAVGGRALTYRIYRNDTYWWYQYNSFRDFKLRFKTDSHSYLVANGAISSATPSASIPFQPSQQGQYLIEVQDAANNGHISSIFVSAYPYGGIPSGDQNAGTLSLRSEKSTYNVGEDALLTFPSPRQGNVLLTVERGNKILLSKWVAPNPDAEEMNIKLKMSEAMTPNVYVTVTVLQEHAQTVNDRPIRMFGILPLTVINPKTKQELVINMSDELKPKEKFDINISTLNGNRTQFTVAVVDEGLLDLTNFITPNPWKEFFKKIRLEVETYDLFAHVIGANEDDVFKTFSIGGDMDYRESQVDPFEKKKRFKPVCMFKGPLMTDSQGKARVQFEMPNYVGSVRVMVISAQGDTYGSAEKTVPVKSDLIVQPTMPRALKPGDEFEIPVNVFATKANIGKIDLSIETEGPLEVIGQTTHQHTFEAEDDKMFYFKVRVKPAIGQTKITIIGKGNNVNSVFEADIPVSPSAARIYDKEEKLLKPGESITFKLPKLGLDGTNNARLYLSVFPDMDFLHRLEFLIRYPYGCIEQTTSSVFPQLALKSLLNDDEVRQKEIDNNINAGIIRLRMFQLADGGFSYWPGGPEASPWGTNYAAQFLFEARKKGYVVPDAMYDGVVRYLDRESRRGQQDKKFLMTRVNRCYVLALANKAPINEMNLLKQNHFNEMSNVEKWQLITAYQLAGAADKVQDLVNNLSTEVEAYNEFGHTYGSRYRDLGIILRCLVLMERNEDAALMAKYVAKTLSGRSWYSTQTLGQMLLGIGNYFEYAGISATDDLIIEGEVTLPNGKKETIKSVDKYALYINEGYGQDLKISLNDDVKINQLYATLASNGVPLTDNTPDQNKNINMQVSWFNEDGEPIDISNVKQGQTIYGNYKIRNTSVIPMIDEVALVQLLPSGWEIENTRLSNEVMPGWMQNWNTGNEEYLDIRDDRIMWFFDLRDKRALDFVVKINVITKGTFELPGARCEAMYNADYIATKPGQKVRVVE